MGRVGAVVLSKKDNRTAFFPACAGVSEGTSEIWEPPYFPKICRTANSDAPKA